MPRSDSFNVLTSPKRALLNLSPSSTDEPLVAGIESREIVVLQVIMVCGADPTDVTFCSLSDDDEPVSTEITPLFANAGNGGAVLPFTEAGWFSTLRGETLCATSSAGSDVGILIAYVLS